MRLSEKPPSQTVHEPHNSDIPWPDGLEFRVQGLGFKGFRVQGLGVKGFRVQGLRFKGFRA